MYRLAYKSQKGKAARRGIEFCLTYDEWLSIWRASGNLEQRGRGKGKYCMARYNDVGPYAVGNVFITTHERNSTDWQRTEAAKSVLRKMISVNTGEHGRLAKLSSEEAAAICRRHAGGENWRVLATEYSVSRGTVYNIINGQSCYSTGAAQ